MLQWLRGLEPDVFLLMGQNFNSNCAFFLPRLRSCLDFYTAAFDCHDETVIPTSPVSLLFEHEFHGRNIVNIISCEGLQRMLRAEKEEEWCLRLLRRGWRPLRGGFDPSTQDLLFDTIKQFPHGFGMLVHGNSVMLHWKGTPLVFVSQWQA